MIIWKKYKGSQEELAKILSKVGYRFKGESRTSNNFLAWCGFLGPGGEYSWEPRLAYIVKLNSGLKVEMHGIQGNVGMTHYSIMKSPKTKNNKKHKRDERPKEKRQSQVSSIGKHSNTKTPLNRRHRS